MLQLKNPINVTDIIETKTSKKRKHGNPDSWWSIDTIPIGRIIVKQIISLSIPEKTLAILYKDISSTFYVRYWQINADSKPSRMVRQFPEFQEEPLLIIPMTVGGHIALTRSAIFYFPEKKIHNLTVSKEVQDVTVSDKSNQLYFVKSLVLRNSKVDEQNYISYEIIDEHRILLTSQSGKSNMLYIDLESSSTSTIIINQVSMISLGDVTIPNSNGLHHITGDLFFKVLDFLDRYCFWSLPFSHIFILKLLLMAVLQFWILLPAQKKCTHVKVDGWVVKFASTLQE